VTPDSPYKGLASFGDSELDALLFFGRDRERETIVANVLANRLTVLYGPSGVGKTSLLAAGVAQGLRTQDAGAVIVHSAWAGDPIGSLSEAVRREVPEVGPTAGFADTVAAAAHARGEIHLLLDQFEDCFRYPEAQAVVGELPELLRRAGLRLSVLIALRDDALAELDTFTTRLPDAFGNLLRLDALDRRAAREAIMRPLEQFSGLTGEAHSADPDLVDTLLDEIEDDDHVETPFLQLVLERLWAEERASGSRVLRLETLGRLGGAQAIVRTHVQGSLARLPGADEDAAARVVRQLVTPSGAKLSHPEADLATLADVEPTTLRKLVSTLERDRILRGVDGAGRAPRIEIYHDVLAEPLLAWRQAHELERERRNAHRERRRLLTVVAAALLALAVVTSLAAFAFLQRSSARSQARRAHAHELEARALGELTLDPASSLRLALQAAQLSPDAAAESTLRASLLALREEHLFHPGGDVVTASFSPSADKLVAAGSGGASLFVSRSPLARLVRGPATAAAWSADGREVAIGSADGAVRMFSSNGRLLRAIYTRAPIAALSYAGQVLLAGSGGHVRVVYGTRGAIRKLSFPGAVVAAALSPDRRFVAVASRRNGRVTTSVIDVGTRRVRATLDERGVDALAFSPDGKLLATGSTDKTARLWGVPSGRLVHVLPQGGHVVAVRFSPRGRLLLSSSADGSASTWDVRRGIRDLLLVGATGAAEEAAFSPDGTKIAVAFADGDARLYDGLDGRLLALLAGHTDTVTSVGFDATGRTIVTSSADGTVRRWSTTAGDELVSVDRRAEPVVARFVSDDVIRTFAGRIARFVSVDGKLLRTAFTSSAATAKKPVLSPDGTIEATIHGREVDLRDVRDGHILHRLVGHRSLVTDAEFSPDGRMLVTASDDHLARIWDVATGALLHVLRGHFFAVRTASFSPDARWVVTASQFSGGLWDVSDGQLLQYLRGHTKPLTGASFSPDGRYIVTGGEDGVASIVRCEICANLPGLEQVAQKRLAAIGR
jgi:WD40 repeat protein